MPHPNQKSKSAKVVWLHIALLLVAVALVYYIILHAPFSSWDDKDRVINNVDIRGLGWANVSAWFSSFYISDYQPLSMFVYALCYAAGKLDPYVYHLCNVLLHGGNTIIVYLLIVRMGIGRTVSLFTALAFALHPVQVENVAWIAEQQTLLCGLFFFAALLAYASYLHQPLRSKLWLVFVLGMAAMLCKAIAVTLPITLASLHIIMRREINIRKTAPLFVSLLLASLTIGIVAIAGQASGNWLYRHPGYNAWQTLLLATYNYIQYVVHIVFPAHLSLMYPYPGQFTAIHYLYLIATFALLGVVILAWRRRWHVLCGGIVYYSINIALLLQFLQYGEYMMADRFLYIPSIGILLPAIYYPVTRLQQAGHRFFAVAITGIAAITLFVATWVRTDIWTSDLKFSNSILASFPNSAVAEYSVGALCIKEGRYDEAAIHLDKAIALDRFCENAWYNKGVLYLKQGKRQLALDALNKCLAISAHTDAYFTRAMIYMSSGQTEPALADAEKVLSVQPHHARAWYIKGHCAELDSHLQQAISYYNNAITNDATEALFYTKRGCVYAQLNNYDAAWSDVEKALVMSANNAEALYYRGVIKYKTGQNPCIDFAAAIAGGYKVPDGIMANLCP